MAVDSFLQSELDSGVVFFNQVVSAFTLVFARENELNLRKLMLYTKKLKDPPSKANLT